MLAGAIAVGWGNVASAQTDQTAQPAAPADVAGETTVEAPAAGETVKAPAAGAPIAPALTPEEVPPEAVAAVARSLNCPLCQGYSLQDCPLEVCTQMRALIAQKLAAGQTKEQITAAFVADYGPQVLNAPPTTGLYITAWVFPVLVLVAAALLAAGGLWRGARRDEAATTAWGGVEGVSRGGGGTTADNMVADSTVVDRSTADRDAVDRDVVESMADRLEKLLAEDDR